jgi:hypothetical protein
MTGVLKRLDDVRVAMKELGRELASPNQNLDPDEVNRKITERIERAATEVKPGNGLPAPGS